MASRAQRASGAAFGAAIAMFAFLGQEAMGARANGDFMWLPGHPVTLGAMAVLLGLATIASRDPLAQLWPDQPLRKLLPVAALAYCVGVLGFMGAWVGVTATFGNPFDFPRAHVPGMAHHAGKFMRSAMEMAMIAGVAIGGVAVAYGACRAFLQAWPEVPWPVLIPVTTLITFVVAMGVLWQEPIAFIGLYYVGVAPLALGVLAFAIADQAGRESAR